MPQAPEVCQAPLASLGSHTQNHRKVLLLQPEGLQRLAPLQEAYRVQSADVFGMGKNQWAAHLGGGQSQDATYRTLSALPPTQSSHPWDLLLPPLPQPKQ